MYLNILLLPLITILIISLFGLYLGHRGTFLLINIMMLELWIISIFLVKELFINNNILSLNTELRLINNKWEILLDNISALMIFMIITISWIVIIYTYDYMINDAHIIRFNLYIVLFIWNMLILITTSNICILFIGWEGVGLSSYLLISYWYTRLETNLGGLIAILMNRIGDMFIILSMIMSYVLYNTLDLNIINILYDNSINDYFIILLFIAAMVKSAQLYFHVWLPYSMEGPTPISALIHAATMVTAGVYLLLRISIIIKFSYYSLFLISIIGSLTCFIGSILAIVSLDMKELIAYSTMSQLGYMVCCIGVKLNNLSYYHLIFHAYFKALLFLTVGSILHIILDIQDLRKTGGLINFMPIIYILLLIGLTSLIGLPFTTGYYSKESIIMMSYNKLDILSHYIFIITLLTAFITIFYSYKFIYSLFINHTRLSIFILKNVHYYSLHLLISLSILSIFTIYIGYILIKWNILLNMNLPFLNHNISIYIKLIPLLLFILAFYILNLRIYSAISSIILNIQFGYKYLYIYLSGIWLHLSYRILSKIFDYGYLDLLFSRSGDELYSISSNISKYILMRYIFSFFLFGIFIIISIN